MIFFTPPFIFPTPASLKSWPITIRTYHGESVYPAFQNDVGLSLLKPDVGMAGRVRLDVHQPIREVLSDRGKQCPGTDLLALALCS